MKHLEITVGEIASAIQKYESGEWLTVDKLRELLRGLSNNRYHLTAENIEAHNRWNTLMYNSNKPVSRAKVEADYKVPELRQTRKLLETINFNIQSIIMEISSINKES